MSSLPSLPSFKLSSGLSIVGSVLLGVLLLWALVPEDLPLTQLEVRGEFQHLQPEDVRGAAQPYLAAPFFSVNLDEVRVAVAALPWVARVRVERQWPGAISVRVWERQSYARWNDDAVLDTESRAFTPHAGEIPTGLPLLGGSPGHEMEVAQTWHRLSPALSEGGLQLIGLSRDVRGEWTARTVTGIELRFGQDPPDERLPMLTQVAQRSLEGRWEQVQYIDLRYTNGFAVGWREAESTGGQK